MKNKADYKVRNLEKALSRLEEALKKPRRDQLSIDGTIQRFEFVLELFWKTMKVSLEKEGLLASTPREVFQEAYRAGWLANGTVWLNMLYDRNATLHVYDERIAKKIYSHIKIYFPEMKQVFKTLKDRLK